MAYTENRDHDLLVCLVEGIIRGLNKEITARRSKVEAISREISALLSSGVDINHDARYNEMVEQREQINKELFQLEKRREKLFHWMRYMRNLDADATLMRKNQDEYQQMQLQAFQEAMAYLQTPENAPTVIAATAIIIQSLNVEIQGYASLLTAIGSFTNTVKELHDEAIQADKDIDKCIEETEEDLQDLEKLKIRHPEHAAYIDEMIRSTKEGLAGLHEYDELVEHVVNETADDSEMNQALQARIRAVRESKQAAEAIRDKLQTLPEIIKQHDEAEFGQLTAALAQPIVSPSTLDKRSLMDELREISGGSIKPQNEQDKGLSHLQAAAIPSETHAEEDFIHAQQTTITRLTTSFKNLNQQILALTKERRGLKKAFDKAVDENDQESIERINKELLSVDERMKQLRIEGNDIRITLDQTKTAVLDSCRRATEAAAERTAEMQNLAAAVPDVTHHYKQTLAQRPHLADQVKPKPDTLEPHKKIDPKKPQKP